MCLFPRKSLKYKVSKSQHQASSLFLKVHSVALGMNKTKRRSISDEGRCHTCFNAVMLPTRVGEYKSNAISICIVQSNCSLTNILFCEIEPYTQINIRDTGSFVQNAHLTTLPRYKAAAKEGLFLLNLFSRNEMRGYLIYLLKFQTKHVHITQTLLHPSSRLMNAKV